MLYNYYRVGFNGVPFKIEYCDFMDLYLSPALTHSFYVMSNGHTRCDITYHGRLIAYREGRYIDEE